MIYSINKFTKQVEMGTSFDNKVIELSLIDKQPKASIGFFVK